MLTRKELRKILEKAQLGRIAEPLSPMALPCLQICRKSNSGENSVGISKIGGTPDFPDYLDWPRCEGKPLSLLAQI